MAQVVTWMDKIDKRLDHQDACIDAMKRQIWMATGALGLMMVLINLALRIH